MSAVESTYYDEFRPLLVDRLLSKYGRYMELQLFVDVADEAPEIVHSHDFLCASSTGTEVPFKSIAAAYREQIHKREQAMWTHSDHIDAGFDLLAPEALFLKSVCAAPVTIDYKVVCAAQMVRRVPGLAASSSAEHVAPFVTESYNTGYYLYPRSSISKTYLRLANSTGIIDAGYRGHLMAKMDLLGESLFESTAPEIAHSRDFLRASSTVANAPFESDKGRKETSIAQFERHMQICAPELAPIMVTLVDNLADLGTTVRGSGGFGSTGK